MARLNNKNKPGMKVAANQGGIFVRKCIGGSLESLPHGQLPITSHTLDQTRICASEAKLLKQNQWEAAATWTPKGHINGAGDPTPLRQKALKPSIL